MAPDPFRTAAEPRVTHYPDMFEEVLCFFCFSFDLVNSLRECRNLTEELLLLNPRFKAQHYDTSKNLIPNLSSFKPFKSWKLNNLIVKLNIRAATLPFTNSHYCLVHG